MSLSCGKFCGPRYFVTSCTIRFSIALGLIFFFPEFNFLESHPFGGLNIESLRKKKGGKIPLVIKH